MSQLRQKPEINDFEFTRDRIPVHQYSEQSADFDAQMKNYRMHNSRRTIDDHEARKNERSLTPTSANKHTDQLMAWKEKKNLKLANKRLTLGQEDLTFSPRLNQNSLEMVVPVDPDQKPTRDQCRETVRLPRREAEEARNDSPSRKGPDVQTSPQRELVEDQQSQEKRRRPSQKAGARDRPGQLL